MPQTFIDHTHPWSVLALTNRAGAKKIMRQVLGNTVIVIPYVRAGFDLALAVAREMEKNPHAVGAVLMHHGLITWGNDAKESYDATIDLVTKAETYLTKKAARKNRVSVSARALLTAKTRYRKIAPIIRGSFGDTHRNRNSSALVQDTLTRSSQTITPPNSRVILKGLIDAQTLSLLDSPKGKQMALSAPLTPDFIIRTCAYPLWIDKPKYDDPEAFRKQFARALQNYSSAYCSRFKRYPHKNEIQGHPKVFCLPGLGVLCAGKDNREANIARDITRQNLLTKKAILDSGGTYRGLFEDHLLDMECHGFQQAKLQQTQIQPLTGSVALVTGSAGAIGSGITRALLEQGCNVAVTDLAGKRLDASVRELQETYGDRVLGLPLDVTDPVSVSNSFDTIIHAWGGIDLIIINAGIAHVSSLEDMDIDAFRRLERVNVEGTLLVLGEAARHFRSQGTGGDIVLITTKNVFAPGAKFGAYSATKASSHQLARIASLELAEIGVRVNMVAPDAVFGNDEKKSGLWQKVGPDRMRARGLDEKGLEEYYRKRSLLKTRITPEDVARAVLFFATRQTPTTGATLPVDGGLPDATPR